MVLKKLPSQYKPWVFAFFMSFNTALIVSGVISFIYSPSIEVFWHKWQMAFFLGWPSCIYIYYAACARSY